MKVGSLEHTAAFWIYVAGIVVSIVWTVVSGIFAIAILTLLLMILAWDEWQHRNDDEQID